MIVSINILKQLAMSNLKSGWLSKSFLLMFLFVILFSSCKKDEVDPDYVGTWSATGTLTEDGISTQIKDNMIFSRSGFTELVQVYDATTSKYIDYIKLIGTLTVTATTMNITVTEIGISSFDIISGKPTGTIATYKDGTSQFNTLFAQTGLSKTFKSEYSVSGNQITIKTDNNNDGDYLDVDEVSVYTKE